IRRAEERAATLVSQQEISRQAQAKATEILTTAQQKSKVLRSTTNEYVESMLGRIEELLSNDLADVKKAKAAIKNSNK
ncbi:MAG: ATPase, partial [Ruminiclostridium sp.]